MSKGYGQSEQEVTTDEENPPSSQVTQNALAATGDSVGGVVLQLAGLTGGQQRGPRASVHVVVVDILRLCSSLTNGSGYSCYPLGAGGLAPPPRPDEDEEAVRHVVWTGSLILVKHTVVL